MVYTSPYPPPPPLTPVMNAYHIFFDRPDQQNAPWNTNFSLFAESETGREIGYRDFLSAVGVARKVLTQTLNLKKGEIVGVMCENCIDFPILIHGLMSLGIPFALIAPYSTPRELEHAFALCRFTTLFVGARQARKQAFAWPPGMKLIVINGTVDTGVHLWDMMHESASSGEEVGVVEVPTNHVAYLVFSSGTTGLPKAVMITHGNVIFSIYQVGVVFKCALASPTPPLEGHSTYLAFLPIHHTYGLHTYCFRSFITPATYVFMSHWNLNDALKTVMRYKITNINLIPSVVAQLVSHPSPSFVKQALKTVNYLGSGAAYLPAELSDRVRGLVRTGVRVNDGYGMSEATIAALIQPHPGTLGRQPIDGSCGILLPGMEARIVRPLNDDGATFEDVPQGQVGELLIKSANISPGYFGDSDAVRKANRETFLQNGWLRTGDYFYVDAEENFFFADRAKDTLKVSGIQVSPLEIENTLLGHPEKLVADVAVAGVVGGRTSDEKVPRAWVVLTDAGKAVVLHNSSQAKVVQELIRWCEAQLSKYKWLRGGLEIVDEIPKSPTGKTLRRVLVDAFEQANRERLATPKL